MIWLTSDWHFWHKQPFLWEPRGFTNVEQMNEAIIERHNSVVHPEDIVYCLGDCGLSVDDPQYIVDCMRRLNGQLHIITGNHDTINKLNAYKQVATVNGMAQMLIYKKRHFMLSHYPMLTGNLDDDKAPWNRVYSLCGHSHTTDKFADWHLGPIYHVEMDAHNCYPVSIDTVIEDIRKKLSI